MPNESSGFGHVGSFAQLANVSDFIHAENSYLAIAIDSGVIGTIIYVTFFICAFLAPSATELSPIGPIIPSK